MTGRTIAVDARGMACPWPALRLARAARTAAGGDMIRVQADDPQAAREIAALATARGWTLSVEADAFVVGV